MNTSFEYYRIFYYVAKFGNYTKASKSLLMAQPNITRVIKQLENDLGCSLFVRSNKGVTLTRNGVKLFSHVCRAVEEIEVGESELNEEKSLQSGSINISTTENALHELLLPTLELFKERFPKVRISISNHSTPQAIKSLKNMESELAFVTTHDPVKKPLFSTKLKPFNEILVSSYHFPFLYSKKISLKDLSEVPLISLGKNTKTYEFYNDLFLKYNLTLSPQMEAATTNQILPMVKCGLGIGFLPLSIAQPAIEKKEIFEVKLIEKIPERYVYLIINNEQPLSLIAKEFISTAKEIVSK